MSSQSHAEHGHDGIVIHIDNVKYTAPHSPMTGMEIRSLVDPPVGPDRDLFLVVPGPDDDRKIGETEAVELKPGTHFYTAPTTINPGQQVQLPQRDEDYLKSKGWTWELQPSPAGAYLLLKNVSLSPDRYDHARVELMLQIPAGYPMAGLDMFYVSPHLQLKDGGAPTATCTEEHYGRSWQRFSRHLPSPWRPNVDGLAGFLALALGELAGRR